MSIAIRPNGMNNYNLPVALPTPLRPASSPRRAENLSRTNGIWQRPLEEAAPAPLLRLHLLGTFEASLFESPLSGLRSDKARALLAYLAVENNRAHRREALAMLLWGGYSSSAAKGSLRQTLSNLRQVLTPLEFSTKRPVLDITRYTVQFNVDLRKIWIDVHAFDAHLAASKLTSGEKQGDHAVDIYQLERAVELYRGDFLAGLALDDCPEFEQWRLLQQEEYHRQTLAALEVITAHYLTRGEASKAQKYARRQLAIEPWHEYGHRQLMEALAMAGQRGAAIQQFETCTQILAEELGVEPVAETVELYHRIRSGENTMSPQPTYPRPSNISNPLPPSPYHGLYPYSTREASLFSGQNEAIGQLEEAIRRQSFVALIGPSGSGKSSLVAAGLLPQLQGSPDQDDSSPTNNSSWLVAALQPGNRPLLALAEALIPHLEPDLSATDRLIQANKLAEAFKAGELSLSAVIQRIQQSSGEEEVRVARRFLLVVDPLEDIFRHCEDREERIAFCDLLLEATTIPRTTTSSSAPCTVLVLLRTDFVSETDAYPPLAQAIHAHPFAMTPISRESLREAIELPAMKRKIGFEPGLVSRLLDDIGSSPNALPLAQLTLAAVWEKQSTGPRLTHAAYDEVGRMSGVLARHAAQFFSELGEDEQVLAKQVLLDMVHVEEHTEATVREVSRDELGEQGWKMAQRLADARIVSIGQDPDNPEMATLVHPSLLTEWQEFREWIDEERAYYMWRNRFRTLVWRWLESNRDETVLLQDKLLEEAESWMASHTMMTADERVYLQASIALRERDREPEQEQAATLSFWETLQNWNLAQMRKGLLLSVLVFMVGVLVYMAASAMMLA